MAPLVNIYTTLEQIRERKAMYLGNDYTFKSLESFILGFCFAAQPGQLEQPDCNNFNYFSCWLIGHLKQHHGLSAGWYWQILSRHAHNKDKAFEEFFAFLDLFKSSTRSSWLLTVSQAALAFQEQGPVKRFVLTPDKEEFPLEKPFAIRKIRIANSTTMWVELLNRDFRVITEAWYLTEQEATDRLRQEFGEFLGEWVNEQ